MDQLTVSTYDTYFQQYDDQTANFWRDFPRDFINKFSGIAGEKILDIGSGPGRDAEILRELGHEIICLDASASMLKICQEKGFETSHADLMKLPFEKETFDSVWAYTSLLHLPRKEISKALKEIWRVLKNDGAMVLGMIEGNGEEYLENLPGIKDNGTRLFCYYQVDELEKILKQEKFQILELGNVKPRSRTYLSFLAKKTLAI